MLGWTRIIDKGLGGIITTIILTKERMKLYLEKQEMIFPPIQTKTFTDRNMAMQMFVMDHWFDLSEYFLPTYALADLESLIQRQKDGRTTVGVELWVQNIRKNGSITTFQMGKC
jgi:hypothetical protein